MYSDAFILNIDDWLSSSTISTMSAVEERGFLHLLMHLWKSLERTGKGLPDCDEQLASWALVSLRRWRGKVGAKIRGCFRVVDGLLYNDRLQREFNNWKRKQGRQATATAAANARWNRPATVAKMPRPQRTKPDGFESAAGILERMPVAYETDAKRMHTPCDSHATAYSDTSYKETVASVEATEYVADTESLSNDGAKNSATEADTMTVPNHDELKQAQVLLKDVAKRSGIDPDHTPDLKITAQILVAAGGLAGLIPHLRDLQARDLRAVTSYGYFLRAIQARATERVRAG
jgi:uncharacterized protein YdaU (DUF1376 family)